MTQDAQAFVVGLRRYFPKAFCQIRASQRLTTAIEVKVRDFPALEQFIWQFAANAAIVSPTLITPEQAKASIFPPAAGSNVVSFTDRTNTPTAPRTAAKTASNGFRTVSIE